MKVYTDTNRYPDNIDNDSACSIPLGALDQANNSLYYRQTNFVEGNSANVSGTSVSVSGGTHTLCSGYGTVQTSDGHEDIHTQAPAVGMGVYDETANKFLGNIVSVASANSFMLDRSPGNASAVDLLISAYGGCGPADYFGGAHGRTSGQPSANYWDHCNWGSRNIIVKNNTFTMDASKVTGCTTANGCGFMMAEVFNAGVPSLMRYFNSMSNLVANATNGLGVDWSNNVYSWTGGGPGGWQFWADNQGHQVTQAAWRAAPYNQDAGSTF